MLKFFLVSTCATLATWTLFTGTPNDFCNLPTQGHGVTEHSKPSAPIAIAMTAIDTGSGSTRLEFALTPEIDLEWIQVSLELPHGGRQLDANFPTGASERGEVRQGTTSFELPERVLQGIDGAEVHLVARIGIRLPDGTIEAASTVKTLFFGSEALPVSTPVIRSGGRDSLDMSAILTKEGR